MQKTNNPQHWVVGGYGVCAPTQVWQNTRGYQTTKGWLRGMAGYTASNSHTIIFVDNARIQAGARGSIDHLGLFDGKPHRIRVFNCDDDYRQYRRRY